MSRFREDVLGWAASGHLRPADVPRAFQLAGAAPSLADWRRFVQSLLLWVGVVLIASGVVFFFAYNWQSLHRFGKFGLAEVLFAASLVAVWRFGIDHAAGKAALLLAALLTGALLALYGQTYQTGADAYELLAAWAGLILPWVLVSRFGPLWLLWVGLLNLAVGLYAEAMPRGLLGIVFGSSAGMWSLLLLNTIALAAWEFGLARGVAFLSRWGARALGVMSGGFATAIGVLAIAGDDLYAPLGFPACLAWLVAVYLYYRYRILDVFMLSGGVLSLVILSATFLGKHLLRNGDAAGFLLIGLVVIAISGAGAWWIRRTLQERTV